VNSPRPIDEELTAVVTELRAFDPDGSRTARVLRDTFDQLYDGRRTGRYRWDQLYKTEKTHCGTLVEINLQREFKFSDGESLDYLIGGIDVDCKYSQTIGGWMIPPEARDHICLVLSAADTPTPTWSLGLVRASAAHLNLGANRDAKSTLNTAGRNAIVWIHQNAPLPPNVLLQLDPATVDRIFAETSGQKRINELFRSALGTVIGRAAVATVAQQDDYMKRVRANGGARTLLQPEGIIILGQFQSHVAIARALGVPVPGPGDSVSVRVTPAKKRGAGVVEINARLWKMAAPSDPIVSAPDLPSI
jgi:Restriction endonuclease NaeI